jgi:ATP-dependent DNA ligase
LSAGGIIHNKEELETTFESIVFLGYEGLVVKNLDESFLMQKWVKMKPKERMTHGATNNSN